MEDINRNKWLSYGDETNKKNSKEKKAQEKSDAVLAEQEKVLTPIQTKAPKEKSKISSNKKEQNEEVKLPPEKVTPLPVVKGGEHGMNEDAAEAELISRLKRIEELEKSMKEKEERMTNAALAVEQKAKEMEDALRKMEEKALEEEAKRLARNQLLEMAAGPLSYRSQQGYGHGSARGPPGSSRTPRSGRMNSARNLHATYGPPTARSARDGTPRPAALIKMEVNGVEWIQLWDPQVGAWYWFCESTQASQWEQPGEEGYNSNTDAMTDYSTDNYASGYNTESEPGEVSAAGQSEWQEYWDEQAQSKYWYNNITGEASWTSPAAYSSVSTVNTHSEAWVSYIDEATGQEYWYNAETGETSWA